MFHNLWVVLVVFFIKCNRIMRPFRPIEASFVNYYCSIWERPLKLYRNSQPSVLTFLFFAALYLY